MRGWLSTMGEYVWWPIMHHALCAPTSAAYERGIPTSVWATEPQKATREARNACWHATNMQGRPHGRAYNLGKASLGSESERGF